jgi:hypothetical protein
VVAVKALVSRVKLGAGEGIRTLDPNLGKVVLYRPASLRRRRWQTVNATRNRPRSRLEWEGEHDVMQSGRSGDLDNSIVECDLLTVLALFLTNGRNRLC